MRFLPVQRAEVDPALPLAASSAHIPVGPEKMTPVWQKLREAAAHAFLGFVPARNRGRLTAALGDPLDLAEGRRREDDHPVAVPASAPPVFGVAQRLWRPARQGDFLQLALGEEADVEVVRRPEGVLGLIGSRHLPLLARLQRMGPQPSCASQLPHSDRYMAAVGRKAQGEEVGVFRQRDRETVE